MSVTLSNICSLRNATRQVSERFFGRSRTRKVLIVTALDGLSKDDVAQRRRTFVAVPLGSTEQHGPHLPVGTDTAIATALAEALASARGDVVVAPAIAISASGEHQGFAGTLSIGTDALVTVIVELCRSADWADGVVLVNGHGGNAEAIARAHATLVHEQRRVLIWWPSAPDDDRVDAHAGWLETSVMLHLAPESVHMELAARGATEPIDELIDRLRAGGIRSVSASGVLGNPVGASAHDGARMVASWSQDLIARFDSWAR